MREATGNNNRVDATNGRVRVPEQLGVTTEIAHRPLDVELAIGARELDDANGRAHAGVARLALTVTV